MKVGRMPLFGGKVLRSNAAWAWVERQEYSKFVTRVDEQFAPLWSLCYICGTLWR